MVIKTRLLPPGAVAVTIFPLILIHPRYAHFPSVLLHESVHIEQQRIWFVRGLGVGLLVWWLLYLIALPAGWNPFRRKWETEAMLAEGRTLDEVAAALKRAPYYLWWS